jgi:hypothetical protein
VPLGQLLEKAWWWLDLFRYEFPLPSRTELAQQVDRLLTYFEDIGAMQDGELDDRHPLVAALVNVLQNFRESYYVVALTTLHRLGADGLSEKALLEEIRKYYKTCLLLGEVTKSEGTGDVLLKNALSRYTEMGFLQNESRGRGGRERWTLRGPGWDGLEGFVLSLEESLRVHHIAPRA